MNITLPAAAGALSPSANPERRGRIYKAAQEFEELLLSSLLKPLEQSFSSPSGQDAGADDYGYMAIQGLAGALSKSGGIGIADLLARQLMRTEVPGEARSSSPPVDR